MLGQITADHFLIFFETLCSPSMDSDASSPILKHHANNPSYSLYLNCIAISLPHNIIVLFILIPLIHVFFQRHVLRFSFPLYGRVELFDACNLILKSHQLSYRKALRKDLGTIFFFFFNFWICEHSKDSIFSTSFLI